MCYLSTYPHHIYMKMCNGLLVFCLLFPFLVLNVYLQCLNFVPFWNWFLSILSIFVSSVDQVSQYKLSLSCTRCPLQLDNIQLYRSFIKSVQICLYLSLSLTSNWLSKRCMLTQIYASAIKTLAFDEKSQHLGLSVSSSGVPHVVE